MENSVTPGSFSKSVYRPLAVLAYPSMALFGCLAAMSLFLAVLGFSYALFHRDLYSPEESGSLSIVFQLMALFLYLEPFARVMTIIVFLAWIFRAHKNLSALKVRGLEFTPGWAVGLWFIPLVNFVKPFQVMREIWHGSDPENEDNNNKHTRAQKETPEILGFWWGVLLAAIFTGYIANIMAGNETREENTFYPAALVLSTLLRFGALVLIILIVKEITMRQELRFQTLAGVSSHSGAFPPPPPTFSEDI